DQLQLAQRLFNTEAEVLHQLGTHEQIPQLLAYFEEAGDFFLIQEFIDGTLLFDRLKTRQRWFESDVTQFLEDVLTLLCFVHNSGAIHRDIKPGNLIQRPDGKWVLLDFGAVKQVHLTQLQVARDMSITVAVGTPGYLAPESICGKPRFSSDIFSLGVVAICALTGLSPDAIQGDPVSLRPKSFQSVNAKDWRDLRPDISDRLKAILGRMTQLNFALRYTTAQQVLTDLTASGISTCDLAETGNPATPAATLSPPSILPTLYLTQFATQTLDFLAPLAQKIPVIQNVRKSLQLVGVGLCVGLSIGGLHQLARASQARARAQLETLTAALQGADYSACIEAAQAISPFSPIHIDSRDILGDCQLAYARQQAQSGHMRDAIATAHQVPHGATTYTTAQAEILNWSDRILELAAERYRQGELDKAIAMADAIPNYSPARATARRTIGDWRQEWQRDERRFQQAQQAFERGEWNSALSATEKISSIYWQTRAASISEQSNARLQPAPQPEPSPQPTQVSQPAPVVVSAPPPAPQPQAVATPATPQPAESQQQEWIQIQRNIERVQRQQARVQQERARVESREDDWDDDDWDDDDDDDLQPVRAQSNRSNRNRNVTLEDRVVNELETQIRRGVERLLN
ncbi:MAG: serine/threonine-protein kinase, partial [Cyanobacteria bacterium P01_E01_bin.34]